MLRAPSPPGVFKLSGFKDEQTRCCDTKTLYCNFCSKWKLLQRDSELGCEGCVHGRCDGSIRELFICSVHTFSYDQQRPDEAAAVRSNVKSAKSLI